MEFIASILHSIGFNWHVALANFVNFLIVLFILNKFVFKKVFSGIESRQELIKSGLENATLAQQNLQKAVDEAESIIIGSKKEGERIFESIIDKGNVEVKALVDKSNLEALKLREDLNSKISSVQADVESNFAKVAPELVANLLRKALGNIDEAIHNKVVSNLVK